MGKAGSGNGNGEEKPEGARRARGTCPVSSTLLGSRSSQNKLVEYHALHTKTSPKASSPLFGAPSAIFPIHLRLPRPSPQATPPWRRSEGWCCLGFARHWGRIRQRDADRTTASDLGILPLQLHLPSS